MLRNFKKEDLRIVKTHKALITAMPELLSRRNFKQITVNDLCEEALVSRAAFYSHFDDKYDLLSYCLGVLKQGFARSIDNNIGIDTVVPRFIDENSKAIKNLITDANSEVSKLVHDFMLSILDIFAHENKIDKTSLSYMVLSDFCAGGMVNLLSRQIKNGSLPEMQKTTAYLFKMLSHIMEWDADNNNWD